MESSEAHTDGLVNEAAALLKAALEPRAPAEVGKLMDWSVSTINRSNLIQHMGVSWHGGTPKWMVYNGQSHIEMDDDWGYPHFGKPPYRKMKRWDTADMMLLHLDRSRY